MVTKPRVGPNRDVSSERSIAHVNYVLYLVGIVVGITILIGLVLAYINDSHLKGLGPADGGNWIRSHFRFQIRTFWIGALYCLLGGAVVGILFGDSNGIATFLALCILLTWLAVRCVKGMKYLNRGEAHANPTSWLFG